MYSDIDEETQHLTSSQSRQYSILRSDLSAALTAFDRAQDWADLIHDLQRVNRVLNKHANTSYLPDKQLLGKRLAQCLTSFLPSGVHLKALETYHIVFARIGPDRLALDLPLYAAGLFPLLSYCSTSLKPPLLAIYETHLLPLKQNLAPILDGFVLAILPGLDDETSEFYSRSRRLLDNVAKAVKDTGVFSRAIWRALLLSPPVRYAAAHYLRSKLSSEVDDDNDNPKNNNEVGDQTNIEDENNGDNNVDAEEIITAKKLRFQMVTDMPLVAYAITSALSDADSLTQRNVLDLLLGQVALDAPFFCASSTSTIESDSTTTPSSNTEKRDAAIALVGGVFVTLLRRDMSLTKRVHTWLLGGRDGDSGMQFCERYCRDLVLAAIDKKIESSLSLTLPPSSSSITTTTASTSTTTSTSQSTKDFKTLIATATRPCRVSIALIDRLELCECLGRDIARRMLDFGRRAVVMRHPASNEINSAIADVLNDIGSAHVFADLQRVVHRHEDDHVDRYQDFELLSFSLSMLPTHDSIIRTSHLPALVCAAVRSLPALAHADPRVLEKAVVFCSKAVLAMGMSTTTTTTTISSSTFVDHGEDDNDNENEHNKNDASDTSFSSTIVDFASFFVDWLAHAVDPAPSDIRKDYALLDHNAELDAELAVAQVSQDEPKPYDVSIAKSACALLVAAAVSTQHSRVITAARHAVSECANAADVRVSLAGARAFSDLSSKISSSLSSIRVSSSSKNEEEEEKEKEKERKELKQQIYGVIRRCWRQMHPSLSTATAQAAQTLLSLQSRFPHQVHVVMADGMLSPFVPRRLRNLERFACVWRLAVEHRLLPLPSDDALFLMLDALADDHWGPKMLARSWLSDALDLDPAPILDAPLRLLLSADARTVGPKHEFAAVYDAPRALYALQSLRAVLESSLPSSSSSMSTPSANATIPTSVTSHHHAVTSPFPGKSIVANGHPVKSATSAAIASSLAVHRGRLLAATPPSPRTAQALATVFALPTDSATMGNVPEGPVPLAHLLPAHSYVVAIALTCLGYLRGRVPQRLQLDVERQPRNDCDNKDIDIDMSVCTDNEDDLEWTLAGLGPKPLVELHEGVSAAAAECLATLLAAIPVPTHMSSVVANLFAQPVLNLVSSAMHHINFNNSAITSTFDSDRAQDPVLELHFLNAVTFLVTADGPSYVSSVHGKHALFSRWRAGVSSETSMLLLPGMATSDSGSGMTIHGRVGGVGSSNNSGVVGASKLPFTSSSSTSTISDPFSRAHANSSHHTKSVAGVQVSSIESLDAFIPWLLSGVASLRARHDSGAHQVLGVRRRWILLIDTVMKHIGVSIPVVTEGLLLILARLLHDHHNFQKDNNGRNELSRSDDVPVLLEGIAVVSSSVLASFEYALTTSSLKDGATSADDNIQHSTETISVTATRPAVAGTGFEHSTSEPSARPSSTNSIVLNKSASGVNGDVGTVSQRQLQLQQQQEPNLQQPQHTAQIQTSASEALQSSSGGQALVDKASFATSSMINALNPLRMINDFVKDVWTGSGADGTHRELDPRRAGARILFCLLPSLMRDIARVWGPTVDSVALLSDSFSTRDHHSGNNNYSGRSSRPAAPPRLSTELPRERRQLQRSLVLAILEPMFEIRPLDVIAAVISIFYNEQDEFGALFHQRQSPKQQNEEQDEDAKLQCGEEGIAHMACSMLHALDIATPDTVIHCAKIIFEKAVKWEASATEAVEGRAQATLRQQARLAVSTLVSATVDQDAVPHVDLSSLGKMAPNDHSAPLPGGTTGVDITQLSSRRVTSSHQEMFHWGDFFAVHAPGVVQTACLNFIDMFLSTCSEAEDTQAAWTVLFPLLRDGVTTVRRKAAVPALLRTLGSFVMKNPSPFPDRRIRREIMLVAALAINASSTVASIQADIPIDEHHHAPLFKKKLAIVALSALSTSVPPLIDSAFSDDRPQLSNAAALCVGPAVTTLKKAAARAAAIAQAANSGGTGAGTAGTGSGADIINAVNANSTTSISATSISRNNNGTTGTRTRMQTSSSSGSTSLTKSPTNRTTSVTGANTDEALLKRQELETRVDLNASEAAADVLLNIGRRDWGVKLARQKLMTLVEDGNFFYGKNGQVLRKLSAIVRDVVANGGASFLLTALGMSASNSGAAGIPSLFIGRDSETVLRARAIRRIAYIVFVSEPDYYSAQLPTILERVRDVLRMTDSALVVECLFCLRALLLRTGPSSISAFRATILAEMFRILSNPQQDLPSTMSVLRFLDVVSLLSPPEYGYERCFFFGEKDHTNAKINEKVRNEADDRGDIHKEVKQADENGDADEQENINVEPRKRAFAPLVAQVASNLWKKDGWSVDEVFAAPLTRQEGKLVLGGTVIRDSELDGVFVGRYAAGLVLRNTMPMMKAAEPDKALISSEFEKEFLV